MIHSIHRAYAKINLGLRVLRKRADGYHDLETVFHRIALHDVLTFEPASTIQIRSSSPDVPSNEANLCHKAAKALQSLCGVKDGVRISLAKNIPAGAGMGGGSSDAATVLRCLPAFWGTSVDATALMKTATSIGSDVPYFLGDGTALATGRGEVLTYFSLMVPFSIVACHPGIHVSTAWAYGAITPNDSKRCSLREVILQGMGDPSQLRDNVINDFEPAVFERYPAIASLKQTMLEQGADFALMSGSGASVYAFFADPEAAQRLAVLLQIRGLATSLTPAGFVPPAP